MTIATFNFHVKFPLSNATLNYSEITPTKIYIPISFSEKKAGRGK